MDRILHSWFYILHHSIYLKTNFLGPQLRVMPLLCQCNGHKTGRLSQTTLTIPQPLFQSTLNLVKTICFSCHAIKHNSRGLFFSWIYAPEITLSRNPGYMMLKKTISWPLRLFISYNPISIKTYFTLIFFPPTLWCITIMSFCHKVCFSSKKLFWGWFVQLKQVLQKKRSRVSLTQEVTTSFQPVRNSSAQAVELLELMKCSSTSATRHSQYQTYS